MTSHALSVKLSETNAENVHFFLLFRADFLHGQLGLNDGRRGAASGTWFGETSRQSQAERVKQQQKGISPNHVPEAFRH